MEASVAHRFVLRSGILPLNSIEGHFEPEDIAGILNAFFDFAVHCIVEHDGIVHDLSGESIVASWNSGEGAIHAALAMREKHTQHQREGKLPLTRLCHGIHCGKVVYAPIGPGELRRPRVLGDVVNEVARVQQINRPFATDVLVSGDCYETVRGIFRVESMSELRVKGRSEPQTLYAVLGRSDDPDCVTDLGELRMRLKLKPDLA